MELTIEEAIQRVKAEIIAPDWRLSVRRADSLEEAFACLEKRFRNRKGLTAILTMAGNVLQYIRTHGDHCPPDSIDFLKEAMADVVNLYEEADDDPEREERLFTKVFAHFRELKEKIKMRRRPPARGHAAPAERSGASPPAARPGSPEEGPQMFRAATVKEHDAEEVPVRNEAERFLAELSRTLERAEEVGAVLQKLIQTAAGLREGHPAADPVSALPAMAAQGPAAEAGTGYKKCPPTALREVVIGDRSMGLPEESIALLRPLTEAAREKYLREGQVPLRDFHRLFSSLARRFEGMLATHPDRKLKKLVLPVISLQAVGMPELPDAQATTLLVLSYGHWHGVLFCSDIQEESRIMTKFRKAANGDIAGVAALEGGGELPVANVADLLRREGFLAIV